MSEPFVGELKIVGFNFNPRGWLNCDGQILQINTNTTLFSLFGTMYGGDGRTTFGVPELRGRSPIHVGQGPGLPPYPNQGASGGAATVTLDSNHIPSHSHNLVNGSGANKAAVAVQGVNAAGDQRTPGGNLLAQSNTGDRNYIAAGTAAPLNADSGSISGQTALTGGGQAHQNMPPYQVLRYVVATVGLYPSRN